MTFEWKYIDAHGHINGKEFDKDRDELLGRAREEGVAQIVVGTDSVMSAKAVALADGAKGIWATVGQHPTDNHAEVFDVKQYREWLLRDDVVGIGECGLDYYWPASDAWPTGEEAEKARQKELFAAHIQLAIETGKPLMIHGRPTKGSMDAYDDIITQIKDANETHNVSLRGNIHFFVGTPEIAKQFLLLGFTMSFTGVITFSHDYNKTIESIPLDMILAETDAPYVSPKPFRGTRNEPVHVREVYKKIAELKQLSVEVVRDQLNGNVVRVFTLPV